MGSTTGISWTNHTWNPWQGCDPVTAGCDNCYMFREKTFHGQDPNVWLGVTCEHNPTMFRVDQLLEVPAQVYFISYEPAIGPIDWQADANMQRLHQVDWIIVGGESGRLTGNADGPIGNRLARRFEEDWLHTTLRAGIEARTAVWMKQFGSVYAAQRGWKQHHGADPAEWPQWARVQELPTWTPPLEQLAASEPMAHQPLLLTPETA